MIKVYGAKSSMAVLKGKVRDIRVNWLLEELKVPYERISLDPSQKENFSEGYLKINPFGKVPSLVDDTVGANPVTLFESGAICEYLAGKYKKFQPEYGTADWHIYQQWVFLATTSIEPAASRILMGLHFLKPGPAATEFVESGERALVRYIPHLNSLFKTQLYLMKSEFSVADILLCCAFGFIDGSKCLDEAHSLKEYMARCLDRPAYKAAYAKNGEA